MDLIQVDAGLFFVAAKQICAPNKIASHFIVTIRTVNNFVAYHIQWNAVGCCTFKLARALQWRAPPDMFRFTTVSRSPV